MNNCKATSPSGTDAVIAAVNANRLTSAIFAPLFFIKAHDNFKLYRDSQVKVE